MRHPCGCVNEVHAPSGVLHSVSKCKGHRKESRRPEFLGQAYYEELGCFADGIPQCPRYMEQIREALGGFLRKSADPTTRTYALEVGCGASMYAPGLLKAGYWYVGLDENEWAARWTASTFDVPTFVRPIETLWGRVGAADVLVEVPWRRGGIGAVRRSLDLILAAHVLEHLEDGPGAIGHLAGMLDRGGELWIIVPDDSDPVNPDHLWFFTEATLRSTIESAGLVVERFAIRRHVPHENFLYARARKPT